MLIYFSGKTIIHDSYNCMVFRMNFTKAFPTKRLETDPYNFIGAIQSIPDPKPMLETCPKPCRPKNHEDWIYC